MKKNVLILGMAFFFVMPFFAQETESPTVIEEAVSEVTEEAVVDVADENPSEETTKLIFISADGDDFPVLSYVINGRKITTSFLCNSNDTITVPNKPFYVAPGNVTLKGIPTRIQIIPDGGVQTWKVSKINKAKFGWGFALGMFGSLATGCSAAMLLSDAIDGRFDWRLLGGLGCGIGLMSFGITIYNDGAGKIVRIE